MVRFFDPQRKKNRPTVPDELGNFLETNGLKIRQTVSGESLMLGECDQKSETPSRKLEIWQTWSAKSQLYLPSKQELKQQLESITRQPEGES
ncbi:MAG: hypothetical protein PWQ89_706 [Verrucomicrobiota bacterium]|jgi:hypothetical protein|nr:hypothetical protein [Verrucomicrobiota bacterium]